MRSIILYMVAMCVALSVQAQVIVRIGTGTEVQVSGPAQVVLDSGRLANEGIYKQLAGTLKLAGGVDVGGGGNTMVKDLVIGNNETSRVSSTVSVYGTARLDSGTVYAGNELYLRSDSSVGANMVVRGALREPVRGLITRASATSGSSCSAYTSTLSLNISGPVMVYQWQESVDMTSWADVAGASSATYTATVTATKWYRCKLNTTNTDYAQTTPPVALYMMGDVPVLAGATTLCVGATTSYSATPSGGAWTSSNASVATVSSAGVVTGVSAGSATIVYTSPMGCVVTKVVTVSALGGEIGGPSTLCVGSSATMMSGGSGGTWSVNIPSVASIDRHSGSITGLVSGVVNVTYTLGSTCIASRTVTVLPTPSGITGGGMVCEGRTITMSSLPTGGIWEVGTAAVGSISAGGVLTGIAAGTTVVSYKLSGGCGRAVVVTVMPTPTELVGAAAVCTGAPTTITVSPSGGTWTSSNTSIATVAGGVVNGLNDGVVNISYTLAGGCRSITTMTVNRTPATVVGASAICAGASTTLTTTTVGGSWSSSDAALATVGGDGTVTGVSGGIVVISYTMPSGCSRTKSLTINASPSEVAGASSVCMGETVIMSALPAGGSWSSSPATIGSIAASGALTGMGVGTARVTYTLAGGCRSIASVVVAPMPTAISGAGVVCVGGSMTLTAGPSGGTWSSSDELVATTSASGVVTSVAAGTATITYAMSAGCYMSRVVTVGAMPAAITGDSTMCVHRLDTLYSSESGAWTSSNPAVVSVTSMGAIGVLLPRVAGVAVISFTSVGGCVVTKQVTVNPNPTFLGMTGGICVGGFWRSAVDIPGGSWSVRGGLTIDSSGIMRGVTAGVTSSVFYTLSTGCFASRVIVVHPALEPIVGDSVLCVGDSRPYTIATGLLGSYSWYVSSSAIASYSFGLLRGISAGVVTLTYGYSLTSRREGGGAICISTKTITVNATPGAIGGNAPICEGASRVLSCAPGGGVWSSGDTRIATVDSMGLLTGVNAGTISISYTIAGMCRSVVIVTVLPMVRSMSVPATMCTGQTVAIAATPTGGVWTSSVVGVATVSGGVITAVNAGVTNVSYTMPGGCRQVMSVRVDRMPTAIGGAGAVCVGGSMTLTAGPSGGTWSSSDELVATTSASGVVTSVAAGTATITYAMSAGCYVSRVVTVGAMPAAITGDSVVCANGFVAYSTGEVGVWRSSNPAVLSLSTTSLYGAPHIVSAGVTTISFTSDAGCVLTRQVTVNPSPSFRGMTSAICVGGLFYSVVDIPGGTWSAMGGISVNSVGVISGVTTGLFSQVRYTLPNGCSTARNIIVQPALAPIVGDSVICVGDSSVYTCASSLSGGLYWHTSSPMILTVIIDSGIVVGISAGVVTLTYSDYYSVSSTYGGGPICMSTKTITVNPLPVVSPSVLSVCVGASTMLTGTPSGGMWISDRDGVASVAADGTLTGVSAGTALITYTTGGACDRVMVVTVNAMPSAISGPTTMCVGATATLGVLPSGGAWSSSSIVAGVTGGVVTARSAGVAVITYATSSICYRTHTITVNATPETIVGAGTVCTERSIALSSLTSGGAWTVSNPMLMSISTGGVVTGLSAGTGMVSYTLPTGCSVQRVVTVLPTPAVSPAPVHICNGSTQVMSGVPSGGTWASSNTGVATINAMAILRSVSVGTTTVSYTATNGCARTLVASVNAMPDTIVGSRNVCLGGTVALTGLAAGGTWSSSNAGVASVHATTGVVTGASSGTAAISYTAAGSTCYKVAVVTVNTTFAGVLGMTNVCLGNTATIAAPVGGGVWTAANVARATINASTGLVTGVSAGTTVVSYTVGGSCVYTGTINVTSVPATLHGSQTLCNGGTASWISTATGGAWSSSNTGIATINAASGLVSGVGVGVATISYTIVGCVVTRTVTVQVSPTAIAGPGTVPVGGTAVYSSAPTGGTWTSSNPLRAVIGATMGSMTVLTAGAGPTIGYTLPNGCAVTKAITIGAMRGAAASGVVAPLEPLVYPNPNNGQFSIRVSTPGVLKVLSLDGKEIAVYDIDKQITACELPKGIASGMYMGIYTAADGVEHRVSIVYLP